MGKGRPVPVKARRKKHRRKQVARKEHLRSLYAASPPNYPLPPRDIVEHKTPVDQLDEIPQKIRDKLRWLGIETPDQLLALTPEDLTHIEEMSRHIFFLKTPLERITDLPIGVRFQLRQRGVTTVGQFLQLKKVDLTMLNRVGPVTVKKIQAIQRSLRRKTISNG